VPQARGFTSIWPTYVPFCFLSVVGAGAQGANENILIKGPEGNRGTENLDQDFDNLHFSQIIIVFFFCESPFICKLYRYIQQMM
jgi:hypothetical protein